MKNKVTLILSKENLEEDIPYYCMKCRNRFFHINRNIAVVYTGAAYPNKEIPKGMGKVEIKCRGQGCDMVYSFYFQ